MDIFKEDVVISGIGGYFPKAVNLEQFKECLFKNESCVGPKWTEGERGVCHMSGAVPYQKFDNAYFGIHRQQCIFMDPMHRLVLERTFEALIDAGVNPNEVRGRRIGVYMGSAIGENDNLFLESVVSGFGVTGHSRAMMPNRVSYWLNLKGPSVAYDCNWVSGFEVMRLAYNSIRSGQCESVLIGTANLAIHTEFQWLYNDMGLISQDGSTKAFDANASGYARSDGVVVMYLQRASEARRSYASIVHIATRFDGTNNEPILSHSVNQMVDFMDDFYEKCPVKPEEIDYVETYGCALKDIDQKELEAIERVYCKNRKDPLMITSVKSITGHSEASASLFSLVSVLLAMENKTIPATIQYDTPNPEIKGLHNGSLQVVTANTPWNSQYAAINVMGINTYYGHVVLKANVKEKVAVKMDLPMLLNISTRTEDGVKEILEVLKTKPKDPEYFKLIHDSFLKPIQGHLYRGYTVLGQEIKEESVYHMGNKRQVWFIYSGMGSQWNGMLSDFMRFEVFANSIKKSHEVLASRGVDLMNVLTSTDKTIFDTILHSFVGIAAMQIALTDLLKELGIVPDGIIGHSVGELGCAYADGCMTAEQMILSSYSRGRASIEAELIQGMMAAVGLGYNQIKNRLPDAIDVACRNGPESCTISGPTEDMEKFVKQLQDEGVFARLVNVANIAYHSRYIKPAAPKLLEYMKDVLPNPIARSSKWISTSVPEARWETDVAKTVSPEYMTNNLLNAVLFEEGCKHIPKDSILIEIAPHGLLQAILKRSVANTINVPLTQRGSKSGVEFFLQSLGKLYLAGMDFNISKLYPSIEYPVGRGTPTLTDLVRWNHTEQWLYFDEEYKLHSMMGNKEYEVTLADEEFRDCVSHQLRDNVVLPTSRYLDILVQIFSTITSANTDIVFENLHFKKHLIIPRSGMVALHAMVQKGSGDFEIVSNKDILVTGKIIFPQADDEFLLEPEMVEITEGAVELNSGDFYNELQHRGYKYSGDYRAIKSIKLTEDGSVATTQWNNKWPMLLEAMIQQQLLMAGERNQDVHIPRFIQKITICQNQLPTEKTTVQVDFDYSTSMISTPGIQVLSMETSLLDIDESHLYLDSIDVVPLANASFDTIEGGLDVALRLTLNNFSDPTVKTIFVSELKIDTSLADNIKNVANELPQVICSVTTVNDSKQIVTQQSYPQLIVVNDVPDAHILKLISHSKTFLFCKADQNSLSEQDVVEVAQFKIRNINYSIIRKENNFTPATVTIKGDTLSIKDLKRSSASWVAELHSAAEVAKVKTNSIFLISTVLPLEGINNFVQELRSQPDMQYVRFIFNLDKKTASYPSIFKKDLVVSIIKSNSVSTSLAISFKFKDDIILKNIAGAVVQNKTVKYLGINLKDETINPAIPKKNDIGNIDYSAITNSGEQVMGIGHLDKDSTRFIMDPVIQWTIPDRWSLQDAATVPHAYISAYYMLMVKGKLKPGQTVLIHAACSPIGLAAASIATYHGCQIFCTVSSYAQRAYLKKHISTLDDYNILNSDNDSFEADLKIATNGKGAHVILNCVSGNLVRHSLACIADYGSFIQYGKYDVEEGNSIGMFCFLRNTSFYVVNLENVLVESKEVKEQLKKFVEDGIENTVVRPLIREVFTNFDVPRMLSQIKRSTNIGKVLIEVEASLDLSKLNIDKPNKFICNSKNSYLVYGGTADNWTDITEWLVLRGAKKIVVSSDSRSQQNYINRRLSLLQTYFEANIVMAPSKAHTKEGAAELLSEVSVMGPIHAVFILPNKNTANKSSDLKPIQYLDTSLRTTTPKAIFLNFVNTAAGICNTRAEAGFSTYNIQWSKDGDINDSFLALDSILSSKASNVLVKKEKIGESKYDGSQAIFKDLRRLLPTTDDIIRDQKQAPEEPDFIQVITEGPVEIRELAPLFLIPGFTGRSELDELVKTLLYPTFCARYPSKSWPIEKLAEALVEKMKAIFPRKVYNLVSISTGGVLAVEIARVLHRQNASITLFFIDSAPSVVQHGFKQLGDNHDAVEVNALRLIFDINNTEILNKIKGSKTWESRVEIAMELYKGTERQQKYLHDGLLGLSNRMENIVSYKPNEILVPGKIFLMRPGDMNKFDDCGLKLYCQKPPQTILVNGDHLSIIMTEETSDYINKNVSLK